MNQFSTATKIFGTFVALTLLIGCAGPPSHSYVVDYQVIGDRTVKYIYVPGERSDAGSMYLNQSIDLEICTLDDGKLTDEEIIAQAQAADSASENEEGDEAQPKVEQRDMEYDCRQSRVLRTQEYR